MTQAQSSSEARDGALAIDRRVAAACTAWKAEAKALLGLAAAFKPLAAADAYSELGKLNGVIERVQKRLRGVQGGGGRADALLGEVRAEAEDRKRRMHEGLGRDLSNACAEQGLELRVLRREEPVEVRIPPFGVVIDRGRARAEIRFAKQTVSVCEADAQAILAAHAAARAELSADFDSGRFFAACLHAWQVARRAQAADGDATPSERVELTDFLPFLALEMQPKSFRVDPTAANFKNYSRARFAFDMWQLREAGGLGRDGWRMNLGVATGTTASEKNRALFLEDGHGNGEFKLTVFFTRQEERR